MVKARLGGIVNELWRHAELARLQADRVVRVYTVRLPVLSFPETTNHVKLQVNISRYYLWVHRSSYVGTPVCTRDVIVKKNLLPSPATPSTHILP
jgi:hypothetical protein